MSRKRRRPKKPSDADGARKHGDGVLKHTDGADARTASKGESEKADDGTAGEPATLYDKIRENGEAIVVAILLAVIIRHFAVEAFEIPTGSMAPTLYGIHAWAECPNCDTDYNIALRTDSDSGRITANYRRRLVHEGPCANAECGMRLHFRAPGGRLFDGGPIACTACFTEFDARAASGTVRETHAFEYDSRCPNCHFPFRGLIERTNHTGGHKILVTKPSYSLYEPSRWDVIVFTFDQSKNYIKRLVAKPGERIDVWDGDVYINGEIERKYRHAYIQDELWVPISDSSVRERGIRDYALPWREVAAVGSGRLKADAKLAKWNEPSLSWSLNANDDVAVLRYGRNFGNFYSYNLIYPPRYRGVFPSHAQVGDKKIEFVVRPLEGAIEAAGKKLEGSWVGAEIRDGEFTFQLRLPLGPADEKRPAVIERLSNVPANADPNPLRKAAEGEPLRTTAVVALPLNKESIVSFENVDDHVAAYVDGEMVLEIEYTSLPKGLGFNAPMGAYLQEAHSVHLIAVDARVELSEIKVYRDMYYIGEYDHGTDSQITSSVQLGDGEYFAMGDNGPSSSDSRYWRHVPEANLMGKAFAVFWPAWPWNFQCKFIR